MVVTDSGLKTTSGGFKDGFGIGKLLNKVGKKLVNAPELKELWAAGRVALDGVAAAAGIPLSSLRQQYRSAGIDPDVMESNLYSYVSSADLTRATAVEIQDAIDTSEVAAKMPGDSVGMMAVLVASLLAFGVFGKGKYRKFRVRRGRRRRY